MRSDWGVTGFYRVLVKAERRSSNLMQLFDMFQKCKPLESK